MSKIKYIQLPGSAEKHTIDADLLDGKHASEFVAKSGDTMTGDLTINKSLPTLALKPVSNSVNEYKEYVDSSGNFIVSSRRNNSPDAWNNKIVLGDEYSIIGNCFDVGTNIRDGTKVHVLDSWLPGKSANRTFGISPDCVIIEVSYDAGNTWQDAGVSDAIKTQIFSFTNSGTQLYLFPKKDGAYSTDVQVRLTFSNCNYSVPPNTPETQKYDYWNDHNYVSRNFAGVPIGFYIGLYTSGMTSYADIQMANMYRPDEWIDCKMNIPIKNSSVPNCSYAMLDTTKYLFRDSASTSYAHNIRITFRQSTVNQTYATAIYGIIMCGWISSDINNSMCSNGVPYNVDHLTLKTTFDGAIAKRGGTSSQFLKADGSTDSNVYLTQHQNITGKEDKSNKVTSISAQSTDTQYPSAKAVWEALQSIQPSAQGSTFGDGGLAYTYTEDGYHDIAFDGDTESGSLVYLEVSTHYPQYDFYFENITDAAHGIHSLIVKNNTGQPFFIAFNDVDSFSGYIYIGAYGDGTTKPAYNLQPGSRVKLDFYLNSSYVFMTAVVI